MRTAEPYDNAEYSDLTIRLSDGSDIHVHKAIICTQNAALRRLCQNNFSILELSDDDALAAEALIQHLYKRKFDGRTGSWSFWLGVRAIGRKHGQGSLRSTARAKRGQIMLQLVENEEHGELPRIISVIEQCHADDDRLRKIVRRLRQESEFH
ncbi:hypothetical protein MBLNU13_g04240t1 [Cladosporium sp. NU13]